MSALHASPEGPRSVWYGRGLLVVAALLWSTAGLILKSPPMVEIPLDVRGPVLACWRAFVAAAVLVPFVDRRRIRWRLGLVPMVASFAAMNLLFVSAMTRTTSAAAIFLQYTSTVWAFLLGRLLFGDRGQRGEHVALACAVVGIGWIVADDWNGPNLVGNLLGLGSGLLYGAIVVSLRALRDEDSGWLVSLDLLASGLVALPWVLALDVPLDARQWAIVAVMGAVQLATPYFLFARAMRHVTPQEASLVVLIEPLLNPIWVWLCWGEAVSPAIWTGGACIVGGLLLRYTVFYQRRPPETQQS